MATPLTPEYFDSDELIAAGLVPPFSLALRLHVQTRRDLDHELFVSDQAVVALPQLDCERDSGAARWTDLSSLLGELRTGDHLRWGSLFVGGHSRREELENCAGARLLFLTREPTTQMQLSKLHI